MTTAHTFWTREHTLFGSQFKEEMKMRPYIERLISGLVNHNGAREAIFTGTLISGLPNEDGGHLRKPRPLDRPFGARAKD